MFLGRLIRQRWGSRLSLSLFYLWRDEERKLFERIDGKRTSRTNFVGRSTLHSLDECGYDPALARNKYIHIFIYDISNQRRRWFHRHKKKAVDLYFTRYMFLVAGTGGGRNSPYKKGRWTIYKWINNHRKKTSLPPPKKKNKEKIRNTFFFLQLFSFLFIFS